MTEPSRDHDDSPTGRQQDGVTSAAEGEQKRPASGEGAFPATRWSLVVAAGSDRPLSEAALEKLCRDYWQPLYVFIRSRGRSVEDARDLTQTVLSELVHRDAFRDLSAEKGRFRTFLLRCAKNRLAVDQRAATAEKRGGGAKHFSIDTDEGEAYLAAIASKHGGSAPAPDLAFERQWSSQLLRRVMEQLASQFRARGEGERFAQLWPLVAGGEERGRYGKLAAELGVSEASLRMSIFRLRKRYQVLLREEIGQTLLDPDEIDDEINHLLRLYEQD